MSYWSYFFCWLSRFCILPSRGLFASEAEIKKSCIAWYVISFFCCVRMRFPHKTIQIEAFSWFDWQLLSSPHSKFFFFSSVSQTAHHSLWLLFIIYFDLLPCIDSPALDSLWTLRYKHAHIHTSVPWRHVINQTQSLVIIWSSHTHWHTARLQS